jgi:hypothetical protein
MGGFSSGRPGTQNEVNTYILFQNTTTGAINFVWQDDSSGWKGPVTDPVFNSADTPTHIACVTAGAMAVPSIALSSVHDINRCFFQVSKALKQVQYDGSKWVDLGFVPIP